MHDDRAALDHVIGLEHRLLEPSTRGDRAQLERLLHPDFEEIGASGRVFDRAGIIAQLTTEGPYTVLPSIVAISAHLVTDDVVLVHFTTRRDDRVAERSSWWVRTVDGLRVRFHQGTPSP